MSIATKRGDGGETGLGGGVRVSKSSLRVEAYGTVDELNAVLGAGYSSRLNEEVRAVLMQHAAEMERSNMSYTDMFKMLKKKMAKEKGIIL